jgi:hypothetical protein
VRGAQTRREDLNREKVLRSARTISLAAAAQALTTPGVIRIAERQVQDARVDRGRAGPSVGDIEVVRDLLYNTHITPQAIGHGELVCTFTGTSSRICSGVYFLPKGKIIVGGSLQRPAERRIVPRRGSDGGFDFPAWSPLLYGAEAVKAIALEAVRVRSLAAPRLTQRPRRLARRRRRAKGLQSARSQSRSPHTLQLGSTW